MPITPQDHINDSSKKPTQQPSEMKPTPPENATNAACPFIGLEDDPSTRLLFASPAACCHRAEPVEAVDLGHQQAYCLTSVYKLCPVFIRPEWDPLPVELAYHQPARSSSKKRWLWFVIGLVILGLIVGALFVWGNGNATINFSPEPSADVLAVIVSPTKTPTVGSLPSVVLTKTAVASATPNPTNTNTPLPPTATMEQTATLAPPLTNLL